MCVMRVMRRRHEPRGDAGHDTSEAAQAAPKLIWNDDKSNDYFLRIIIFFGIWGSLLKKYYKCHTLRRGEIYLPEVLKMNSRKWIFWVKIFFSSSHGGGVRGPCYICQTFFPPVITRRRLLPVHYGPRRRDGTGMLFWALDHASNIFVVLYIILLWSEIPIFIVLIIRIRCFHQYQYFNIGCTGNKLMSMNRAETTESTTHLTPWH